MSKFVSSPREVEATRIKNVQPLEKRGQLVSVKNGVVLILEDGSRFTVTPEMDVFTLDTLPVAGEWLVQDEALAMTYILSAVRFEKLCGSVQVSARS